MPIPTYYGDEICRVNGIAYARDIMIDTIRHRFGRTGFGGGELGHKDQPYAYKPSPHSSHGRVLELMPSTGRRCGCSTSAAVRAGWPRRCAAQGHEVTGVD